MEWLVNATTLPLYPRVRPGTRCTGGWVGPKTGLEGLRKISPPPGFDPRTVRPVASLYTDWANRKLRYLNRKNEHLTVWALVWSFYWFAAMFIVLCVTQQSIWGRIRHIVKFLDHRQWDTHTHLVGLLFTSDQPVPEAATYTPYSTHAREIHL